MEADISTTMLVSGIISIIALIVFFGIAHNVSKIRQLLVRDEAKRNYDEYRMHLFYGEHQSALNSLKRAAWLRLEEAQTTADEGLKKHWYEVLKNTYVPKLNELGVEFPRYEEK